MQSIDIEAQRAAVKAAVKYFLTTLDDVAAITGKTREIALARTNAEQAELWALKHLEAHRG